MSEQVRYYRVGLFVLLGMALLVTATLIVGGTDLLRRPVYFETYFAESVQGLEVGSPVKMRGVSLGTVDKIAFVSDEYPFRSSSDDINYGQMVYVRMKTVGAVDEDAGLDLGRSRRERLRKMIDAGLRLKVAQQGVTGTAYVAADFTDPAQSPPMKIIWEPELLYVPSAPSTFKTISNAVERLFRRLEATPVEDVVTHLDELLVNLNGTVEAVDVQTIETRLSGLLDDLRETSVAAREVVTGIDGREVNAGLTAALTEAEATLATVRLAVELGRPNLEAVLDNLRVVTEDLRALAATARRYPSVLLLGDAPAPVAPAR